MTITSPPLSMTACTSSSREGLWSSEAQANRPFGGGRERDRMVWEREQDSSLQCACTYAEGGLRYTPLPSRVQGKAHTHVTPARQTPACRDKVRFPPRTLLVTLSRPRSRILMCTRDASTGHSPDLTGADAARVSHPSHVRCSATHQHQHHRSPRLKGSAVCR
jgi:hypothetical protein